MLNLYLYRLSLPYVIFLGIPPSVRSLQLQNTVECYTETLTQSQTSQTIT